MNRNGRYKKKRQERQGQVGPARPGLSLEGAVSLHRVEDFMENKTQVAGPSVSVSFHFSPDCTAVSSSTDMTKDRLCSHML